MPLRVKAKQKSTAQTKPPPSTPRPRAPAVPTWPPSDEPAAGPHPCNVPAMPRPPPGPRYRSRFSSTWTMCSCSTSVPAQLAASSSQTWALVSCSTHSDCLLQCTLRRGTDMGREVQVAPVETPTRLDSAWRLQSALAPTYDEPLSRFAFHFNVRRYARTWRRAARWIATKSSAP
jgi:hypothetical protein